MVAAAAGALEMTGGQRAELERLARSHTAPDRFKDAFLMDLDVQARVAIYRYSAGAQCGATNWRMSREGPFWDVMEGRAEPPPAAVLLGWQLLSVDPDKGTIEVAFTATEQFVNPVGVVQGGFLAAMLDDTLGPALVATLGPGEFAPTTNLQVQFLRPARPGPLVGRGWIVRRASGVGFLAGELVDDSGEVVATATATAVVRGTRG